MSNFETTCPVCENDISITEKEIKRAIMAKGETGGKVLISCPEDCRVLVMPADMPEGAELSQWITDVQDVVCVPILDDDYIRIPAGQVILLGKKTYKPGGGDQALGKRAYMYRYGINPECAIAKNPSMGGKPFKIEG
jgi:hypothetical protein